METKTMSFRDTIILAMSEEMRRDENVFLMGEDVGVFGGDFGTSVGMLEEFGPERVRDCPISEAAISGAASRSSHDRTSSNRRYDLHGLLCYCHGQYRQPSC